MLKDKIVIKIKNRRQSFLYDMFLVILFILINVGLIFTLSNSHTQAQELDSSLTNITFVGDIMLGRYIEPVIEQKGIEEIFSNVNEIFEPSDLVVGNIETSILEPSYEGYVQDALIKDIKTDQKVFKDMNKSGLDLFAFANNHLADYGYKGLVDTYEYLKQSNYNFMGIFENDQSEFYHSEKINNLNFAFINFTDVMPYSNYKGEVRSNAPGMLYYTDHSDLIEQAIKEARLNHDVVVAYVHWGKEYENTVNENQHKISKKLAEWGVDLVVGSHPHVLQPIYTVGDMLVVPSLGNFVFDQVQGSTVIGSILNVGFNQEGKIESITFVPTQAQSGIPKIINNRILGKIAKGKLGIDDFEVDVREALEEEYEN